MTTASSQSTNQLRSYPYTSLEDRISSENTWAQNAYHTAEVLQTPLYFFCNHILGRVMTVLTPGKFGNYNNRFVELLRRAGLVTISPVVIGATLVGSPLAIAFNYAADHLLADDPYLRFLGTYKGEKKDTFGTFNMASLVPPMTLIDGVEDSTERLKTIADQVRDLHFICGQEVDGATARFFANELKQDFSEFYTYLGKSNTPYLPSGLFFACKEKALSINVIPFTGPTVQKTIKRELVVFELQDFCVATMHLDSGNGEEVTATHLEEINQAKKALAEYQKPVILCGDFNEERYKPTIAYQALTEAFVDCIKEQSKDPVITCTDKLEVERFAKPTPPIKQSIDYITYNKSQDRLQLVFERVLHRFYTSDHSLVRGKIIYKA